MKYLIFSLIALIAIAGCATTQETVEVMPVLTHKQVTLESSSEPVMKTVKEFELRQSDERFDPTTMVVNKGDTVRLVFLFEEPVVITLDAYGIVEETETGVVEFVADKKGEFDLICIDCYKDFDKNDEETTDDIREDDESEYTGRDLISILKVI